MVEVVENDGFRLVVRPEIGGSIARFDCADRTPILYPIADPDQPYAEGGGCFPLVPFSNRLRDGRFRFQNRDVAVAPNIPGTHRVVHGFGWRVAWTIAARDAAGLTIAHRHHGGVGWPWSYDATQRFQLDPTGLRIELTVVNTGTDAMPAGLGFHPYFPKSDATMLCVAAGRCAGVGEDGFPIVLADESGSLARFADGRARPGNFYLSGIHGKIALTGGTSPITLTSSSNLRHLVVFSPPDGKSVCVEPVSHQVGALNEFTSAGQSAAGIATLQPGEAIACWMRIIPTAGDAP